MTIREFPYQLIHPNPWQTRIEDDPDHINLLRESIRKNGLLQIPKGRFASAEIQLAFGHSRLRAWHAEFPDKPFPVDVVDLTDRQMADYAIEENERRHELSPIEKMRAIRNYMESFKVHELEAGAPFGYKTQSAVANILRLANLPEKTQELVHKGRLPERYARALVLFSRMDAKAVDQGAAKIAGAEDETARDINYHTFMREFLNTHGTYFIFMNTWPRSWPAKPIQAPSTAPKGSPALITACTGCPWLFDRNGFSMHCLRPACHSAKTILWKQRKLKQEAKIKKIEAPIKPAKPKKEKPNPQIAYAVEAKRLIKAVVPHFAQMIPVQLVDLLHDPIIGGWISPEWKRGGLREKRQLLMAELLEDAIPSSQWNAGKPAATKEKIKKIACSLRIRLPKGWSAIPAGEPKKSGNAKGKRK